MGLRSDPEKAREWQRRSAQKAQENARARARESKPKPMKAKGVRQTRLDPAQNRAYAAMRERSGGVCEAKVQGVCRWHASDPHHRGKQSVWPELKTSVDNLMHVCRSCHDWIDQNQQAASEMDPPLHLWRNVENEILMGVRDAVE